VPTCPRLELLLADTEGVLPKDVAERVRAHLASCDRCRGLCDDAIAREPEALSDREKQRILNRIIGS
jgi:predicted anti-sigma-YlaC factor YlaD